MVDVAREPYPRKIRILHWTIVGLILVQWISAGWMEEFFRRVRDQPVGVLPDNAGAIIHALFGASILVLMLARLVIRIKSDAPGPPRDLSRPLWMLSLTNHLAFYAVLVAMPLTGLASLYFARDFAAAHVALKNLLLALIALHVAGVAYHMLVLRDGALWRMLKR
jgi:cytochrome b561